MFGKISRTKFLCQLIQEKWSKQGNMWRKVMLSASEGGDTNQAAANKGRAGDNNHLAANKEVYQHLRGETTTKQLETKGELEQQPFS